ncbi:MAG: hypothetical protein HYU64_02605 [Armatimonadetes bacterium]|nr:hypothetical protein [Armatimonadota bacterium]
MSVNEEKTKELREQKIPINRELRRKWKIRIGCAGLLNGQLVCRNPLGECPDYSICEKGEIPASS